MKNVLRVILICVVFVALMGRLLPAQASSSFLVADRSEKMQMAPAVQASLDSLQPGEMLTVIVTLRQQADLSRVRGADRAARQQGVIRALQATANATQGAINGFLKARQNQGRVQEFESFWVFNGFSITATRDVIDELAQNPDVLSIAADDIQVVPATGVPEPNLSVINASALWDQGFLGQGVVVANMDSGVDISHPELAARWRGGNNSWFDPYGQHATPVDLTGHGTWTMGVMVGGDTGGTSIGVAPGAQWIAVKIFNDRGRSTSTRIHDGFQWLLDPDGNPNTPDAPQVVNNSWTFTNPGCYLDFEPDLQSLRSAGILPVFAAGNGGPYANSSYSPANNPSAFAVGATDNNDQIYAYSSRGPSTCGGSVSPFPDMVAPGVNVRTTDLWGSYASETGTSLAAPQVAGGLALLLSAYPNLAAEDQEAALIHSAVDLGATGPDAVYGYGRLDLLSAFSWLASAPTATPPPTTPTPTPTSIPTPTPTPTATPVPASTLHVGDLDGSASLSKSKWDAIVTILVHDANESPVANATVSGSWSNGANGTDSCITSANGTCQLTKADLNANKTANVTFSVVNVSQATLAYQPSDNHDPDSDSNGTTLVVFRP